MRPPKAKTKKDLIFQVVNHLAKQITSSTKKEASHGVLEAFQNLIDKIDEKSTYEKKYDELNGRITELQSELNHLLIRVESYGR